MCVCRRQSVICRLLFDYAFCDVYFLGEDRERYRVDEGRKSMKNWDRI